MLDSTRLRNPQLFDKIVTPEEAAALITDGMNVGVSGFPATREVRSTGFIQSGYSGTRSGTRCICILK